MNSEHNEHSPQHDDITPDGQVRTPAEGTEDTMPAETPMDAAAFDEGAAVGDGALTGELDAASAMDVAWLADELFGELFTESEEAVKEAAEEAVEEAAEEAVEETAEEVIEEAAEEAVEEAAEESVEETAEEVIEEAAEEVIEEAAEEVIEEAAEEAVEEAAEETEESTDMQLTAALDAIAAMEVADLVSDVTAEVVEAPVEEAEALAEEEAFAEEAAELAEEEAFAEEAEELAEEEAFAEEAEALAEEEAFAEEAEELAEEEEPLPAVKPEKSGKPKKKRKALRGLLIVLLVLVLLFLLLAGAGYGVFRHYYSKLNHKTPQQFEVVTKIDLDDDYDEKASDSDAKDIDALDQDVMKNLAENAEELKFDDKNVTNILLIGTDNRGKSSAHCRSDSMIILSINRNTKRIVMTSVMRDIYCNIPGHGNTRINAAYAYGGPQLLFRTLEQNFKIPVDRYVQVDFYSFMKVVDAVGGVDMKVSAAELKVMNERYIREMNKNMGLPEDTDKIDLSKAGWLHLNGKQAVAYSRVRYVGNADFGRTERQRKVLTEIFKKSKKLSVKELDDLANIVLPMLTTNLSQGEVLSLLLNSPDYLTYDLVSARMPVDGSFKYMTVRKMSVLGVDFAKNRRYWYNKVYGE